VSSHGEAASRGVGAWLEDQFARVVTPHVEVCQHLACTRADDRRSHHPFVDAQQEQRHQSERGDGEEEVVEERLHEGDLRRGRVCQPLPRPDGRADRDCHQNDTPSEGRRLQTSDHLRQPTFKGLQVFTCSLFDGHLDLKVQPQTA